MTDWLRYVTTVELASGTLLRVLFATRRGSGSRTRVLLVTFPSLPKVSGADEERES